MRLLLPLALAAAALPAHADTRAMKLDRFDKVIVAALVEVELRQGKQDIIAETPDGDFSGLKLEVRDGVLRIGRSKGPGAENDYRLTITAPDYKGISASAASEVTSRHLSLQDVEINVSSASIIELKGACKALAVNVSSGAHFDGEELRCEDVRAKASTGAHADLWVSGAASSMANTGGTITIAGKPRTLEKKTALGGAITIQ